VLASRASDISGYPFVERHGEGIAIASSSVAVSTALALPSLAICLLVLGAA
jgi:hypothetical protein